MKWILPLALASLALSACDEGGDVGEAWDDEALEVTDDAELDAEAELAIEAAQDNPWADLTSEEIASLELELDDGTDREAQTGAVTDLTAAPDSAELSCFSKTSWTKWVFWRVTRITNNCSGGRKVRMIWNHSYDGSCTYVPKGGTHTEARERPAYVTEIRQCG